MNSIVSFAQAIIPSDMNGHRVTLLQRWIVGWSDLMAFEIVPVVEGKDTAQALSGD